jgi:predicted Fe-S protein YdhL (DUF1289 family)
MNQQQQRAVVQQALEAAYLAGFQATGEGYNAEYPFEGCNPEADAAWVKDRDSAIRQLLEQPEPVQEPVAGIRWEMGSDGKLKQIDLPLTTPPAQPAAWVGLTDDERIAILRSTGAGSVPYAVEAKLREKNAPQPADQPDYEFHYRQLLEKYEALQSASKPAEHGDELTIAYMSGVYDGKKMAKCEWVGLTDDERESILDREFRQWWSRHDAVCRAIEAKLREKNGGAA